MRTFGAAAPQPQPYAAFIKDATRTSGLLDILNKDDEIYFDLGAAELDHPYLIAPTLASGVGAGAFAGRVFPTFVLEFKRVGNRVLWIEENESFAAPPNSAAANALAISVTNSVINATPIVAEDKTSGRMVISADFFLSDFEDVGKDLAGPQAPILLFGGLTKPGFSVDPTRSYFETAKALPENDEIGASLAFVGPPGSDLPAAPDSRGVQIRMHYSIVAPPDDDYVPRIADDRVGYFVTTKERFDDDSQPSPYVRYIDRWNFERGPIVYYLTNEIPAQYKPVIRTALLEWNKAFAKVGIPDAIEVRNQPDDPSWDPDDVRYSTVRWITSAQSPFAAYGPHIADPRTGEIIRVEIVLDGEALRAVKRGYLSEIDPARRPARAALLEAYATGGPEAVRAMTSAPSLPVCDDDDVCDRYQKQSASLAAVGSDVLRLEGASRAAVDRYARHWLESVVLHESGHNFGLRHNFVASTLYSLHDLHRRAFTQAHGLVGSVMEYTPVNLSPPGKPQGDYFQRVLGPYDYWAIAYGYERFPNVRKPSDELPELRRIADQSTRPEYRYATDEDANGPLAIDPMVAAFDLSSDPLAYDDNQFEVLGSLERSLDRTYPRDDEGYFSERQTFETMLAGYLRAALLATKYIGGFETSRDHRGQVGGRPPLVPLPLAQSRHAFASLTENVFSSRAMRFSPKLLDDLGPNHFFASDGDVQPANFPIEDAVAQMQDIVMFRLFAPDVMSRIADAQLQATPHHRPMVLHDLFGWMSAAVFDDLGPRMGPIDAIHRGLQRRFTNLMIAFTLAPSFVVDALGYPSDSAPLARYELHRLAGSLARAERSPHLDPTTRAHLEDLANRVERALEPTATRGA